MLQIIGWMGCLYLVLKGLEFFTHDGYRRETGRLKELATLGVLAAWLGAAFFFYAFSVQGSGITNLTAGPVPDTAPVVSSHPEKSAAWHDCVQAARDAVEAAACSNID